MTLTSPLAEELAFFEEQRADLVSSSPGMFVLVKGRVLVGTYPTLDDALREGYSRFGNTAFLAREVTDVDLPVNFTSFNLAF